MAEIAKELGCSVHKVSYWMNKYNIHRRSHSEAAYLKANPEGDPFAIKIDLSPDKQFLLGMGLGIYWGEGNKSDHHAVRITNTDPQMLLVFKHFLKEICSIKESKLSYSIVAFNDSDIDVVSQFWSIKLGVPSKKFGKIVQIHQQGKGKYKNKSKFGVCSISFGNIKLKKWIMDQLFSPDSSTAERALGKG